MSDNTDAFVVFPYPLSPGDTVTINGGEFLLKSKTISSDRNGELTEAWELVEVGS